MRIRWLAIILSALLTLLIPITVLATTGDIFLEGNDLILDTDGDTYINSATDDEIEFTIGGTVVPSIIDENIRFFTYFVLTTDETVDSSTLTDTGLQIVLPTDPASKFSVEIVFSWDSGASLQDGKFNIDVPANVTFDGLLCHGSTSTPSETCETVTEASSFIIERGLEQITLTGIINSSGSLASANVVFQWAQNVTDATNPFTLEKGSFIRSTRLE